MQAAQTAQGERWEGERQVVGGEEIVSVTDTAGVRGEDGVASVAETETSEIGEDMLLLAICLK